jgi:hypothetical protein
LSYLVNRTSRTLLVPLGVFIAYMLVITGVQHLTNAAYSSFGLYPDEPSHYGSSLLVHDYLKSGFRQAPLRFAIDYYVSYPFFAVGYWPPVFYAIGGLWMLVFDVGRQSALLLTAVFGALIGVTIFQIVRQWCGNLAAVLWGGVFLLLRGVIEGSSMFMVDLPVTLFSFWALLALIRFSRTPDRLGPAVLFAIFASLTVLTKYSGAFICGLPLLLLVVARANRLWAKPYFWLQPVLIGVLCAPWILFTHKLSGVGLPPQADPIHESLQRALYAFSSALAVALGAVLSIAALISIVFLFARRVRTPEMYIYAATPICLIAFLMCTLVGDESRYFLPALPPVILLIARAVSELRTLGRRYRFAAVTVPALLVLFELRGLAMAPRYPVNTLQTVADYIVSRPQYKNNLILLPPGLELPFIAEVAMRDSHRPSYVLLRPTKILSEAGWFGIHHVNYESPEALQQTFVDNPVDLIIVNRCSTVYAAALDQLIKDMVRQFPTYWQREALLHSSCHSAGCPEWEIYASAQKTSGRDNSVFRQRTLKTLRYWDSPKR